MSKPDNKLTVEFGGIFHEGNNFVCNIHSLHGPQTAYKAMAGHMGDHHLLAAQ
jgi:hypothetical protein